MRKTSFTNNESQLSVYSIHHKCIKAIKQYLTSQYLVRVVRLDLKGQLSLVALASFPHRE